MSEKESAKARDARLALERHCAAVGRSLKEQLLPGTGFALFMFDMGDGGALAYISNAERASMAKALREFLERWERQS